MDTKRKMSNRDKMFILIIAAIALVATTYFLVFTKLQERKNALVAENATLAEEVHNLEVMESQKASVLAETETMQKAVGETLEQFPSEVRTENAIYDLNEMYTKTPNVKIQSENFTMNEVFYRQGAVDDGSTSNTSSAAGSGVATVQSGNASGTAIEAGMPAAEVISAAANFTGYRSTVNVAFTAPYKSLKEVVNFINNSENRMTISEISATKGDEEKVLTCSMAVDMYAVSNNGNNEYKAPEVKDVPGVDNLFRN